MQALGVWQPRAFGMVTSAFAAGLSRGLAMSDEKDRPSMQISQPTNPVKIKRFFKVWQTEEEIENIVFKQRWEMFWRREGK